MLVLIAKPRYGFKGFHKMILLLKSWEVQRKVGDFERLDTLAEQRMPWKTKD